MNLWFLSPLSLAAERERAERDAAIAREQERIHEENLRAWERFGVDGRGHDLIGLSRGPMERLPHPGTLSHEIVHAMTSLPDFTSVQALSLVLNSAHTPDELRAALRSLHETGLLDRAEFRNLRNQFVWHYRLTPHAQSLLKQSHAVA